jgi:hypothetical protein
MAHISSIGAGMFSDLAISLPATITSLAAVDTQAEFEALFASDITGGGTKATGTFSRVMNVREFPAIGVPANIVKVPTYGRRMNAQVQGQADAPTLEIKLNFVPADWAASAPLGALVGDGNQYAFRFTMLNSAPTGVDGYASKATGLGSVQNSEFYWIGKIEALQATASLTDANQATLTLTIQSPFYGAYTC